MNDHELKLYLDDLFLRYNRRDFIADDPISIPHMFSDSGDIEISAFLTSLISWGQRKTILKNAQSLMKMMEHTPKSFIISASNNDYNSFRKFVHRTFNGEDCVYIFKAIKNIYHEYGSLGNCFSTLVNHNPMPVAMSLFRQKLFSQPCQPRTTKHLGDPLKNSGCKRFNMFLRWMIRKDRAGVDFGIWDISPALLYCPLDVHTGRTARLLGLLRRQQDDWKAVEELTISLQAFDKNDPVKYDFALFGAGVNGLLK